MNKEKRVFYAIIGCLIIIILLFSFYKPARENFLKITGWAIGATEGEGGEETCPTGKLVFSHSGLEGDPISGTTLSPHSDDLNFRTCAFSMHFRAKANKLIDSSHPAKAQEMINKFTGAGTWYGFRAFVGKIGKLVFGICDNGNCININTNEVFADTEEHSIGIIRRIEENQLEMYFDGKLVNTVYDPGTINIDTSKPLLFSYNDRFPNRPFSGEIKDIKIYNYALEPSTMLALSQGKEAGELPYCPPGDINGDGRVHGADLGIWQINYDPVGNNINSYSKGDLNCDKLIDYDDYNIYSKSSQINDYIFGIGTTPCSLKFCDYELTGATSKQEDLKKSSEKTAQSKEEKTSVDCGEFVCEEKETDCKLSYTLNSLEISGKIKKTCTNKCGQVKTITEDCSLKKDINIKTDKEYIKIYDSKGELQAKIRIQELKQKEVYITLN